MNKLYWLISVVFLFLINNSVAGQNIGFEIVGVTDWDDSTKVLLTDVERGSGDVIDSAFVSKGVFRISGSVLTEDMVDNGYMTGLQFVNKDGTRQINKAIMLEEATIVISLMGENLIYGGSNLQTRFSNFQNKLFTFIDSIRYYKRNAAKAMTNEDKTEFRLMQSKADIYKKKGDNFILNYWNRSPREKFIYSFLPFALPTESNELNESILDSANKYSPDILLRKIESQINRESTEDEEERNYLAVGDMAPGFSLKSYGNGHVDLRDFEGKYVVLNFWASWCKPCLAEMPSLKRMNQMYPEKKLEIVSINVNDSEESWKKMVERMNASWTQVRDETGEIYEKYNVYFIPYNVLIDKRGRVVSKYNGLTKLHEALSSLLN